MLKMICAALIYFCCFVSVNAATSDPVDVHITIFHPGSGVPVSVALSPSSSTIPDTSTSGPTLSTASVTMSDASVFSGSLVSSNPGLVAVSGLNLLLAKNLSSSDDGSYNIAISAGGASATLTLQVAPAPTNPASLLGLYQGQGTSPLFHTWAGRYPDFVINLSFMGPGYGSDPTGNGGYPAVLDFSTTGPSCNNFSSAASGACDSAYHTSIDSLVIPYASHVYAIRINSEWTQSGAFSGPFDGSCNAVIDGPTWAAGVQHLVNVFRSYPQLNNVKLELEAPMSSRDQAYWPGDSYVQLTGFDRYFLSQFDGTSANSWNMAQNQISPCFTNINTGAAWGRAHGKPLMISEWCDTYTDGFILAQFAAWMKNNNVVAQTYWDSNDAISSPAGCKLLDAPARQAAYAAAFGNSSYSGNFWTLLPGATGTGY
jgi:hypothetical protein